MTRNQTRCHRGPRDGLSRRCIDPETVAASCSLTSAYDSRVNSPARKTRLRPCVLAAADSMRNRSKMVLLYCSGAEHEAASSIALGLAWEASNLFLVEVLQEN